MPKDLSCGNHIFEPIYVAIWLLSTIPIGFLLFLIIYGIALTPRWYPPTISALLSDFIELSVSFGFLVACYTVVESYVAIEYVYDESEQCTENTWSDAVRALPKIAAEYQLLRQMDALPTLPKGSVSIATTKMMSSNMSSLLYFDPDREKSSACGCLWERCIENQRTRGRLPFCCDRVAHICYLKWRCFCCFCIDRCTLKKFSPMFARVFLMLKNASFIMIPIVRVNEYPTMHYTFAILTVVFSLLMFGFYIVRRQCDATPENPRTFYIFVNYAYFSLVFILSFVFALCTTLNSQFITLYYGAIVEYAIFFLVGAMPIFWIADHRYAEKLRTSK